MSYILTHNACCIIERVNVIAMMKTVSFKEPSILIKDRPGGNVILNKGEDSVTLTTAEAAERTCFYQCVFLVMKKYNFAERTKIITLKIYLVNDQISFHLLRYQVNSKTKQK